MLYQVDARRGMSATGIIITDSLSDWPDLAPAAIFPDSNSIVLQATGTYADAILTPRPLSFVSELALSLSGLDLLRALSKLLSCYEPGKDKDADTRAKNLLQQLVHAKDGPGLLFDGLKNINSEAVQSLMVLALKILKDELFPRLEANVVNTQLQEV